MPAHFSSQQHADAELVAIRVAESCCRGKKRDGSPRAPVRYAIIYQAAYAAALAYAEITSLDAQRKAAGGCYCKTHCGASRIMGQQTACLREPKLTPGQEIPK